MKSNFVEFIMRIDTIDCDGAVALFVVVGNLGRYNIQIGLMKGQSLVGPAGFLAANNDTAAKNLLFFINIQIQDIVIWLELLVETSNTFCHWSILTCR